MLVLGGGAVSYDRGTPVTLHIACSLMTAAAIYMLRLEPQLQINAATATHAHQTLTQLLRRNVKRFRGGFVFKAHRIWHHSSLGLGVIKKKKKTLTQPSVLSDAKVKPRVE